MQLNLGVALFWAGLAGRRGRLARRRGVEPDSPYAVAAGQPAPPGVRARPAASSCRPCPLPAELDALAPAAQLDLLRGAGGRRRRAASCSTASPCSGSGAQRSARARVRGRGAPGARRASRRRSRRPWRASTRPARRRRSRGSARSRGASRERGDGPLPPRPAAALVGRGEGGEAQLARATRVEPGSPLAGEARRYLDEPRDGSGRLD